MGYIGLGNRGDQVHEAHLEFSDAPTVAICDLRDDYLDFAAKKSRSNPKRYKDYRKLLEDKTVDAVVIASPDHWHALMCVDACNAGKDVYVEKPLALTQWEGRRMVEVGQKTGRVVQVGLQRRSNKALQEAAAFVRDGGLGEVTVAKGFHLQNEWPNGIGSPPAGSSPDPEMWDKWLGPAPRVPYNPNRMFYRFRWFYDYSGGQVTNFGVHYVDMLRWCLGVDAPKAITALGGHYANKDDREIPDTCEVLWEYPGPAMIVFSQYNANSAPGNQKGSEMEIRGTKGTMYLDLNGWEVVPQKYTDSEVPARTPLDRVTERGYGPSRKETIEPRKVATRVDNQAHARNFLDCVKSRNVKTNCDTRTGYYSTLGPLLGNIALRTKSYLQWDDKTERFANNAEANKLLRYQYRTPYKLG